MTDYLVYDVFTDRAYGGNQLAILPDARDIADAELQAIAREFNYSESVFLFPPDDPEHTAKLRIFTPTMEVPFAGHPTIGTAVMLADAGLGPELTLELGIGPIKARATPGQAEFTTEVPLARLANPDAALVARALGIDARAIVAPPVMASLGLAFVVVQLDNRATLAGLAPDVAGFRDGAARYPSDTDFAIYAWVEHAGALHARMFAPLDDIPEDPATGSAAATLAALLSAERGPFGVTLHQGDDMGRPSRITLTAEPGRVTVAGQAVRVMEGRLIR